jgi:hypothetical protein
MDFMLVGNNDGVKEASMRGVIQCLREGDGGAEMERLNHQTQCFNPFTHSLGILPDKWRTKGLIMTKA